MEIKVIDAKNPIWLDSQHIYIGLEVNFDEHGASDEYLPHTTAEFADTEHGLELYQRAMKGDFGEIEAYSPPVIDFAEVETSWQSAELEKVEVMLKAYVEDMQIPEQYSELRKTHNTEASYYKLLMDRKLLTEYLQQPDFPECGRPTLSGLAI